MGAVDAQTGLWLAVIAFGVYHGVNPGMGWPLALSAGLSEGRLAALLRALVPLAFGHLAAMLAILLPFTVLSQLLAWQREIRVFAALVLIGFGVFRYFNRRHPRFIARIRPGQLALWSFVIAMAHGAGLMLVPVYLGLSHGGDMGAAHMAAGALMRGNLMMALAVSAMHTLAMIAAGGVIAMMVFRYLGLKFISRSWFNLDGVWAASLILIGMLSLALAV